MKKMSYTNFMVFNNTFKLKLENIILLLNSNKIFHLTRCKIRKKILFLKTLKKLKQLKKFIHSF